MERAQREVPTDKKNLYAFSLGFYVGVKSSVGQVPVLVGENFSGHIMGSLTF
jgi:hypothetical protein